MEEDGNTHFKHRLPCGVELEGHVNEVGGIMVKASPGGWCVLRHGEDAGKLEIYFTRKAVRALRELLRDLEAQ